MNLGNMFKSFWKKHKTTIEVGIILSSFIGSTLIAIKNTPKASKVLEDFDTIEDKKLKRDCIIEVGKIYLPSIILSLTGTIMLIRTINQKDNKILALSSIYKITEESLNKYKDIVLKEVGKNTYSKIESKYREDDIKENKEKDKILVTSKGDILFLDTLSNRSFRSSMNHLDKVINKLNNRINQGEFISQNDLYYELELSSIPTGDSIGWSYDTTGIIDIRKDSIITEDEPCVVIEYRNLPKVY